MRALLIAALALAAGTSAADPIARTASGDWVQLTDKPCPAAIVAMVPENLRPVLHAAKAMVGGQAFEACWLFHPQVGVVLKFDDSDEAVIDPRAFHEDAGL